MPAAPWSRRRPRHPAAPSDGSDRDRLSRPGPRLYPRGARPAHHAARRLQGGAPGALRGRPAGRAARGGAHRPQRARRAGQRRDPGRHPGSVAGAAVLARPARARPAGARRGGARRARRCAGGGAPADALARRRRGRAASEARALAALGFGVVTSIHGRGTVPEGDRMSLGAYNFQPPVGGVLRGLRRDAGGGLPAARQRDAQIPARLPRPLYRIDADPRATGVPTPTTSSSAATRPGRWPGSPNGCAGAWPSIRRWARISPPRGTPPRPRCARPSAPMSG